MTILDNPQSGTETMQLSATPNRDLPAIQAWVDEIAQLTQPTDIVWCDGSNRERDYLYRKLVASGTLTKLNPEWRPNSYLARTDPSDVARVESRTFICSETEEDAGPTNNWVAPAQMHAELDAAFAGSMRGRTMYVIPFSMGPIGGPLSQLGVQVTDSPYVVVSMGIMTRIGNDVLDEFEGDTAWVKAVHGVGYPLEIDGVARPDVSWPCNQTKYISHFPETREIWSYGSGYGGNALLGKKSFALRIASVIGRDEGWLAEHMLLLKLTSAEGRMHYIAAAFPSACGKTNLAMLRPTIPGWKVETIGDDIAWLRQGPDGRLWAINPERGFFGVAPGTGRDTNPVAVDTVWGNTIFTNVALRDDGDVWWEGLGPAPEHAIDWQGKDWTPASGTPAAHPNSRFTVTADQCPTIADDWDSPEGVPIDAILFGGRRASTIPLVVQARSWQHGVFMGATVASEQTAAAEGTVGELRRDPFAMLPFCGYNMADYFAHWLKVGQTLGPQAPKVFQVNWFRKSNGKYLWPGFGDNARVIDWILRRLDGTAGAVEQPIGLVPAPGALNMTGLDLDDDVMKTLLTVDPDEWRAELDSCEEYLNIFGDTLPTGLRTELASLRYRIDN